MLHVEKYGGVEMYHYTVYGLVVVVRCDTIFVWSTPDQAKN